MGLNGWIRMFGGKEGCFSDSSSMFLEIKSEAVPGSMRFRCGGKSLYNV
jgi:hypothetical protein